jgi:glycosyltransferase involved in cell wall biosynthesis
MARPRLAIAIPSLNRARMLDAVLRELQPTCEALSIPILVSDNGSVDDTPEVCARWASRWPGFRFQRRPQSIPAGRSVMSAIEMSDAEYTWLAGDDDYLLPRAIHSVAQWLSRRSPDALVVRTMEVPRPNFVALDVPFGPQLAELLRREDTGEGICEYSGAGEFFAAKHIILPAPSVIYPTDRTLATDYERYQETHHAHIGALFDALAIEQAKRGRIDVLELLEICSVSLTVHHDRGKDQWTELFRYLAEEGFPKWFSLLPPIYAPHIPIAEAHHRHIFRAVLGPKGDEESSESTQ